MFHISTFSTFIQQKWSYSIADFLLAHLSTKCSRGAIVIAQRPVLVVRQQFLLNIFFSKPLGQSW